MIRVIISLVAILSIRGTKVKERWGGSYPKNDGCIMQLLEVFPGPFDRNIQGLHKQLTGYKEANCTQRITPLMAPGSLNPNGSYTGVLGMIQRNEITTSVHMIRLDDLPVEVGTFGAPLVSTTGIVLMAENNRTQVHVDLLSIFANFDILTYVYVSILTLVCSSFLSLLTCKIFRADNYVSLNLWAAIRNFSDTLFTFLSSCVCQYNFGAPRFAPRFIWLGYLLTTTFLFYHFGRNLISSDLVVVEQEPHPETMSELLGPKYDHLEIKVIDGLFIVYQINRTGGALKERIFRKESNIITDRTLESIKTVIKSVRSKEAVMLIEEFPLTNFKPYLCLNIPDFGTVIHVSKAKVFPGHACPVYSRRTSRKLLMFLLYRDRTCLETGIYTHYVKYDAPFATLTEIGQKIDSNILKCMDSYKDKEDPVCKDFTFTDVGSLLCLCIRLILITTAILVLEIMITSTNLTVNI